MEDIYMNLFAVEGWVGGLIAAIVVVVVLLLIMLMVFISRCFYDGGSK